MLVFNQKISFLRCWNTPCYLKQTVRIGESEALIFIDCGANIHIIDGSLVEREDLQGIYNSLTVVGGNKVRSQHGTFRFNLGPRDKGEFHEVVWMI